MVSHRPFGLQRGAQSADSAIHHVRRREDVAAGLGLHQALFDEAFDRGIVVDTAVFDDAVVAVVGERIERDVAQHPDLRGGVLHRLDRAGDQAVGVGRRAATRVLSRAVDVRKHGDGGDAERPGFARRGGRSGDGEPLDAGHRGNRNGLVAVVDHHRPDQVRRRQHALAHQAPRPIRLAQPPQAKGGVGG